jgi:hypothetical protein
MSERHAHPHRAPHGHQTSRAARFAKKLREKRTRHGRRAVRLRMEKRSRQVNYQKRGQRRKR